MEQIQSGQKNQNQFLETEGVGTLMRKYALPCIISLLVAALYNIVDQIFIANASYLGSAGNAANTVVFPLTVVALAVAVMIGDGTCAFMSISLGRKESEKAHRAVGNAIVICVAASLAITAVYLIFQDGIITFFGGRVNGETFRNAKEYFFWITAGIPFYMFGQAMNPVIRSDGSPKFAMFSTVSGAVVNIILDPVFIFVCKWGMMGAAVATVLGQILTALLALGYLCRMKTVRLCARSFVLSPGIARRFLALGVTSFLAQISLVAAMAAIQNMCTKYGARDEIFSQAEFAQIPLAVLGIVMKFFQIVISIAVGCAAGCIPVAGYNIGAGRKDRAKQLFTYLLLTEVAVGAVAFVCVEFFPPPAHRHFRRGARASVLHGVRGQKLPRVLVHDSSCNGEQRNVHLLAGDGKSRRLDADFAYEGTDFRSRICASAPGVLGLGRTARLVPALGFSHVHHRRSHNQKNVQGTERVRGEVCREYPGRVFRKKAADYRIGSSDASQPAVSSRDVKMSFWTGLSFIAEIISGRTRLLNVRTHSRNSLSMRSGQPSVMSGRVRPRYSCARRRIPSMHTDSG